MEQIKTIFKYIISSGLSFMVDISIFWLINYLLKNIIIATIIARIISSFVNYLINRNIVFNSTTNKTKTLIQYSILVIVQMLVSAFSVNFIFKLIKIDPTIIKIIVDSTIFIVNYLIQKYLIFQK